MLLATGAAAAQTPDTAVPSAATSKAPAWAFTASAYTYLLPDAPSYVQPAATADRGALHLEARYNYEEIHAASAWAGYNLSAEGTLALEFTPIVGGVVGSMTGVGLGYEGSLSWRRLELSSQGEYVIDTDDASGSFFYNWSQLAYSPADWINFGLVTQRTRVYDTDRDIQRGPFLGFSYKELSLTAFVLNPDDTSPTVIIGLDVGF
jgi:hypothetical protein